MNSVLNVPEVSLISSWRIPSNERSLDLPAGLREGLHEGISLFDLYFLDTTDIEWYWRVCGEGGSCPYPSVLEFAAELTVAQIESIASALNNALIDHYQGKLIGRRPRFAAVATYFPDISALDEARAAERGQSVRAVRNALYLAYSLGCSCLEVVCGAGVPDAGFTDLIPVETYRTNRRRQLALSLQEVLLGILGPTSSHPMHNAEPQVLPKFAIEIEPGDAMLMNSLDQFALLQQEMNTLSGELGEWVFLNVDIAHFFLLGYTPQDLKDLYLEDRVAHMHLSDHAGHRGRGGAHANDLPPNTFHNFHEYSEWLKLAIILTRPTGNFSGVIAIELEACHDPDTVHSALNTTRRWLQRVRTEMIGSDRQHGVTDPFASIEAEDAASALNDGVILVLDLGNSTEVYFGLAQRQEDEARDTIAYVAACRSLEEKIADLCKLVHHERGSIMSFTGDGFIAFFEEHLFRTRHDTILAAWRAADKLVKATPKKGEKSSLMGRVGLHHGRVYLPPRRPLQDQMIGGHVVITARLCQWLGDIAARLPSEVRRGLVGVTKTMFDMMQQTPGTPPLEAWYTYENITFKGLDSSYTFYVPKSVFEAPDSSPD